jgi:hypothetical protein
LRCVITWRLVGEQGDVVNGPALSERERERVAVHSRRGEKKTKEKRAASRPNTGSKRGAKRE